jgi:hypothetical protein
MEISGISLILGKSKPDTEPQDPTPSAATTPTAVAEPVEATKEPTQEPISQTAVTGLDAIKDEEFKETLKKLGQSIAVGEKSRI